MDMQQRYLLDSIKEYEAGIRQCDAEVPFLQRPARHLADTAPGKPGSELTRDVTPRHLEVILERKRMLEGYLRLAKKELTIFGFAAQ